MDIYDGAFTAEERFLATLVMLSPYADWVKFDNYGNSKSLTYIAIEGNMYHPPILLMKDISIIESSGAYFARKFDLDTDKEIIDYFHNKISKS